MDNNWPEDNRLLTISRKEAWTNWWSSSNRTTCCPSTAADPTAWPTDRERAFEREPRVISTEREDGQRLTVFRSDLKCFSEYEREILGVKSDAPCMWLTTHVAVRRPTPLRPASSSDPPGELRTRSTRHMKSRTSGNNRMSSSRLSRPYRTIPWWDTKQQV